jgi:hypothetical protein
VLCPQVLAVSVICNNCDVGPYLNVYIRAKVLWGPQRGTGGSFPRGKAAGA